MTPTSRARAVERRGAIPEKIGRYTILCELGVGGMATVYLGRSRGLGDFERLFAIKMIHENLCESPEFVSLFLNEARIAARIHHPHVVPVYDIDIEDGRYYLSMDYVSGETLQLALQATWNNDVAFPLDVAAHVVACACEGIHAAHELEDADGDSLGVVHRDVTPQNIILGYDGIVRVMDFGIAKALDQVSLTQPGTLRGSVPYMAPEQVNHQPIDRRADVFALGVVLWEITVGKRLFAHHTAIGTIARIVGMEIPRPSTERAGYPDVLEQIVMKSLERDPERRYQTAEDMGEALRRFLVASGICTTSTTIRGFVEDRFGERQRERRTMERSASSVRAAGEVSSMPLVRVPSDLLSSVQPPAEPIDDPAIARRIREVNAVPTVILSNEFETQPATEVTQLPRPKSVAPQRPRTLSRSAWRIWSALAGVLLAVILLAAGATIWPDSPTSSSGDPGDEVDVQEEAEDDASLQSGSVSITDMAGDGGKKGTVAIYFRVIPPSAKITVNGEPTESDLVVPRSRSRYTIQFSEQGYQPQVVTVSAEGSRLIEASLKAIPKVKRRGRRRKR